MELDRIPLWRGNHVPVKTLAEDFARYIYLPRLKESAVLLEAVKGGVSLLTWQSEGFAIAEAYDENENRYRGLRCGEQVNLLDPHSSSLLVKSEVAKAQRDREVVVILPPTPGTEPGGTVLPPGVIPPPVVGPTQPRRYHGTVKLDTTRVGYDAGKIAAEVISHLAGLVGSDITVTLDIEADVPGGVPDNVVRTVTENGRTLKFTSQGFEKE